MRHYLLNLFLLIFIGMISFSCTKEYKLKKAFQNRVFVIDSVRIKFGNTIMPSVLVANILKTTNDSLFSPYGEQDPPFDKYKIKGDTIFLHKTQYFAYHLIKLNAYSYELKAQANDAEDLSISITDVTDLFNNKVDNSKSTLLNRLNNSTWYPTKIIQLNNRLCYDTVCNEEHPNHYIDSTSFSIQNKMVRYQSVWFAKSGATKLPAVKFTNSKAYFYDPIKNHYLGNCSIQFCDENNIVVRDGQLFWICELKRIDPSLLVSYKSIPKKERLGCSVERAEWNLTSYLSKLADGVYVYSPKSIELIDVDDTQCKYSFRVKEYNKQFPTICNYYKFIVSFEDDKKVYYQKIPIY